MLEDIAPGGEAGTRARTWHVYVWHKDPPPCGAPGPDIAAIVNFVNVRIRWGCAAVTGWGRGNASNSGGANPAADPARERFARSLVARDRFGGAQKAAELPLWAMCPFPLKLGTPISPNHHLQRTAPAPNSLGSPRARGPRRAPPPTTLPALMSSPGAFLEARVSTSGAQGGCCAPGILWLVTAAAAAAPLPSALACCCSSLNLNLPCTPAARRCLLTPASHPCHACLPLTAGAPPRLWARSARPSSCPRPQSMLSQKANQRLRMNGNVSGVGRGSV